MIVFYAYWCIHCNDFIPTYKELAKKLKQNNPKILFARIDGSKNEVNQLITQNSQLFSFIMEIRKIKSL